LLTSSRKPTRIAVGKVYAALNGVAIYRVLDGKVFRTSLWKGFSTTIFRAITVEESGVSHDILG